MEQEEHLCHVPRALYGLVLKIVSPRWYPPALYVQCSVIAVKPAMLSVGEKLIL